MAGPLSVAASGLSTLSKAELSAQITELAGHLNAGTYRLLVLVAEFDRRKAWSDGEMQSCAHWLNLQCGIDLGAAREKVRVAHALEKLPKIAGAMARGVLSYSKVRALTRVACPATEDSLMMTALYGTASHVEKLVRYYRRAQEAAELSRAARQHLTRGLTFYHDEDGSLVLKGRLPAEVGDLLLKALDEAMKDLTPPDVSAETSEPRPTMSVKRVDALAVMAESFLQHGGEAMNGGDRHQIVVHVDVETLRESTAGRCELEEGPSLPAETVRRLACDSSVITMVEDENGSPLDVGRKTRSIPPAIRRALRSRDRGCRFPGCPNTRYVDGHHIHHWAHGGATKLSNLVSLCRFHHRQVHEGRIVVQTLDDGALRFVKPNGESFDTVAPGRTPPPGDWTQLVAAHREQGIHIDRKTAASHCCDEIMDYGLALEVLFQRVRLRTGVSAETSAEHRSGE